MLDIYEFFKVLRELGCLAHVESDSLIICVRLADSKRTYPMVEIELDRRYALQFGLLYGSIFESLSPSFQEMLFDACMRFSSSPVDYRIYDRKIIDKQTEMLNWVNRKAYVK